MADEATEQVPTTTSPGDEPDLGKKAFKHFDKQNKAAVTTGVASAATDSSLVTQWLMQTIFSAINLGSHLSAMSQRQRCIPNDLGNLECFDYEKTTPDKWTSSVEAISLALALLMTIGHYCCVKYATKYVMGKLSEGIVALIVLAVVAAGMPAIMNPENQQALDTDGSILNANLYFGSWAGLAVAVYVFCTWLFHRCFKQRNLTAGMPRNRWYLLLAACAIVTASASRIYTSTCSGDDSSSYCNRTRYAIAAGAIGTFGALVASVLSFTNHLSLYPEAGMSFLLFIVFVCGIAFLTFGGDNAPAGNVGNLYFSVWISFILSMFLSSKSWNGIKKKRKGGDEEEQEKDDKQQSDAEAPEAPAEEDKQAPEGPVETTEGATGDSSKNETDVYSSF